MPSIQSILAPSEETANQELKDNALISQPVATPTTSTWLQDTYLGSVKNNISYSLSSMIYGKNENNTKYTEDQLKNLYPDTPDNFWKGGAGSFQAELLYDRFKQNERNAEMENFIKGDNPSWITSGAMAIGSFGASAAGGLTDPLTFLAYGAASKMAAPILADAAAVAGRVLPTNVAIGMMNTLSKSRLSSGFTRELVENTIGDLGMTYPLKKALLDEYNKEETTLMDMAAESFGSALLFTGLKHTGAKLSSIYKSKRGGKAFIEKVKEDNFSQAKDRANVEVNSEAANMAALNEAATFSVNSELGSSPSSVSDRLATKAFQGDRSPRFGLGASRFFGVFEKTSGKSDYVGERFGNTHVFMSSPEAAQGTFDVLAIDGSEYRIVGHSGANNPIDLDAELIADYPRILNVIEEDLNLGKGFFNKINDNTTLAEAFREINKSTQETGMSGSDIVAMFDKINNVLKGEGADSTIHIERVGGTSHEVLSVFEDTLDPAHLEELHTGKSDSPIVPTAPIVTNDRLTKDVILDDGSTTPVVDDIPPDDFYDNDPEYSAGVAKWETEEFKAIPQEELTPEVVVKNIQENLSSLNEDVKSSTLTNEALGKDTEEQFKLKEKIEKLKEELKNESPEEQHTLAKAMENCLRKNT